MVSEVVMYQSMFVLGIIMLAFFTVSFNNYSDFAEEVTLENNMEQVLHEISEKIHEMIDNSRSKKSISPTISLSLRVNLASDYAGFVYQLEFVTSSDNQAVLVARTTNNGEIISSVNLGYLMGIDPTAGEIDFSGTLFSGDPSPRISYNWDSSVPLETLFFD